MSWDKNNDQMTHFFINFLIMKPVGPGGCYAPLRKTGG